jgi:inorganic phosphate transporter, PiT family
MAAGSALNLSVLGSAFVLPLLLSPLITILITMPLYKLAHELSKRSGIAKETCVCIGPNQFIPISRLAYNASTSTYTQNPTAVGLAVTVGSTKDCVQKYGGRVLGMTAQGLVNAVHYASAVAVSFARGLNDTPKIVGLLLVVKALDIRVGMLAIAGAMVAGGLINARKVAETMSKKISKMNDGQALTANLVTAFMVICASRYSLPVSTTHVSVGAISGIGIVNGTADKTVIGGILLSWVLTLPIAAAISATVFLVLKTFA